MQDRESYSDTQDRESYTLDTELLYEPGSNDTVPTPPTEPQTIDLTPTPAGVAQSVRLFREQIEKSEQLIAQAEKLADRIRQMLADFEPNNDGNKMGNEPTAPVERAYYFDNPERLALVKEALELLLKEQPGLRDSETDGWECYSGECEGCGSYTELYFNPATGRVRHAECFNEPCSECGAEIDAEGYDGLCGNCADKAER